MVAVEPSPLPAELRSASTFVITNQIGEEGEALAYLNKAKKCDGIRNEHQRLQIDALEAELTETSQATMTKYRLLVDAFPDGVAA